jgi:nitrogen regulatory protein P-II 1
MIKIEAIVRPERISAVVEALDAAGCGGYNYVNVTGRGNQQGVEVFTGRGGSTTRRTALPKVLITTVVEDSKKEAVITAIIEASRSEGEGNIGDGKIFVSPVSDVVRVRTGERDGAAL